MSFLTREQLLARDPRRYAEVELPTGGKVRIRNLTEREKSKFESEVLAKKGGLDKAKLEAAKRRLIVLTVVDGQGNLILRDEDIEALEEKDGAVTSMIYTAAYRHCGFEDGEIEGIVKNSGAIPDDDSP